MDPVIDEGTVAHLAGLARIDLTDKERQAFTKQLRSILDFFSQIREIDTAGVAPAYHALETGNVFREDEATPSLPQDVALANAPKKERGYFKAPRIIDE